jgi:16S rRNA (guanine966-N2)-methyltransferase
MRITGGELKGRRLPRPAAATRPTQDRVREAVFNMLGPAVEGARVLDLYAGSGAMGCEALSRGARSVVWIDRDRRAAAVLRETERLARELDRDVDTRIACVSAEGFLRGASGGSYDLVFADPPYGEEKKGALMGRLLDAVARCQCLTPGGFFLYETADRNPVGDVPGWTLLRDRAFGASRILIFRRDPESV